MTQNENIALVLQTLADRLQSNYAHQREAAQKAIEAMEAIVPNIMPELSAVPKGFTFEGLYYSQKLELWYCALLINGKPHSASTHDYGKSPRDSFMAIIEKIQRQRGNYDQQRR